MSKSIPTGTRDILPEEMAELRAIEGALALAVTLSLALGIGAGLVLARYVGARLNRIAGVIEAAGEGDLSRRVEMVAGGADSFDRLAARLNAIPSHRDDNCINLYM